MSNILHQPGARLIYLSACTHFLDRISPKAHVALLTPQQGLAITSSQIMGLGQQNGPWVQQPH
jgi:hypothetical protein